VPISETGTATLGISTARALRRNANTTRITRQIAMSSVTSTSCSEARIVVVRSIIIRTLMPCGIDASSAGSDAVMRSTVSMMFALGWR